MAGTTSDKLAGIVSSKEAIRQAIVGKGQTCGTDVKLSDYAGKITAISTGTDVSDTTAVASDVASGKVFHLANGTSTTGTSTAVDTSDANSTASDMLLGKTAYVNGVKITGTIPSQGAQTIVPGTSHKTIAAGTYLSGTQTIYGSVNLVPENIKKGRSLYGVMGTYDPMPAGGLAFYAPLSSSSATAVTGQTLTTTGTPSFGVVNRVPCATFPGGSGIQSTLLSSISNYNVFTLSFWIKWSVAGSDGVSFSCIGNSGYGSRIYAFTYPGDNRIRMEPEGFDIFPTADVWNHVCWVVEDCDQVYENVKGYVNGEHTSTGRVSARGGSSDFYIHGGPNGWSGWQESFAGVRVYRAALTDSEVAKLATEFTPTN